MNKYSIHITFPSSPATHAEISASKTHIAIKRALVRREIANRQGLFGGAASTRLEDRHRLSVGETMTITITRIE